MSGEKLRAFVDVEVLTEHRTVPHKTDERLDWRELRSIRLDGREYAVPADTPVLVETTSGGPQLVTFTLFAGDVRFVERADSESPEASR